MGKSLSIGLATAVLAIACSHGVNQGPSGSSGPSSAPGVPGTDTIGQVGAQLTLPGGEMINTLSYSLYNGTAPGVPAGSYNYSGNEAVFTATTVSFVIAGVASATGYTLVLNATTTDGLYSCTNAPNGVPANTGINVTNRVTTVVNVNMICTSVTGGDAGSILANAMFSACPVWNTIVFNPNNLIDGGNVPNDGGTVAAENTGGAGTIGTNLGTLTAGQSAVLVAGASGPNPAALTFTWTQTVPAPAAPNELTFSNVVVDPNSNASDTETETVVTCPAGQATTTFTIQLVVGETGTPGADCPASQTTGTVQVTCSSAAPCGGNPLAATGSAVGALNLCDTNSGTGRTATLASNATVGGNSYPWVPTATASGDPAADVCCALACGGGTQTGETTATTYPSGTGGCTGQSSNVNGCCWALQPCTSGQPGCVSCEGSTAGNCTPTEAAIVQYDINNGLATAGGTEGAGGCYECLKTNGCLDDTVGDLNHECGDLAGNFTNGATTPVTGVASTICMNTLNCVLNSTASTAGDMASQFQVGGLPSPSAGCQSTSDGLTYCFCGPSGGSASACAASGVSANGACFSQMALGFSHNSVTDTTDIIGKDFNNTTEPSGMANQILLCGATASHCPMCLSH